MNSELVGNIVDKELCSFLEHGFLINISYQTNLDLSSYRANYISSSALINYVKNSKEPSIYWRFGLNYDDSDLKKTVPYPWNMNIGDLIVSALNDYISEADLIRYFELCHNTMNIILTEKENKMINKCGSEKLKLATIDFFKNISQSFNNVYNFLTVENHRINFATYSDPYNTCIITFTNKLSYAQKRKVFDYISYQLLKHYQKWNPTLTSLYGLHASFHYNDSGLKTKPCNEFVIRTRANDWTAIGMDPNAEFVPRIGMKRINSLEQER